MGYFKDILESASTIFEGLAITFSHMFRTPITVQYPDRTLTPVKDMLPTRYRGFLEVDMSICTGCTLCMQACPIQVIDIQITKQEAGGMKQEGEVKAPASVSAQRLISKFDIDIGKCMFCGLCVEPCPTGAIRFTREFERSTENLNELMFKFVQEGKPVVPYKKGST